MNITGNDGQLRFLDCTVSPLMVPGDEQMGSVVVLRDVTEQLAVEEQLRRTQRMDSLGELAFGVAHDFGNLLTTIVGNVELLASPSKPEQRGDCVSAIEKAARRGIALVKQLKGFARVEPIEMIEVDVHAIIEELRSMLERTLISSIRLNFDLRAFDTHIRGNSGQLIQVLLNLSINARDAMPTGGTLSFITSSNQGHFDLWVQDAGVGMSLEVMSKIFNPFFSTKPVGIGSGMGLAMAYSIVKSHGGTIEPSSEVGVGTTFHLRFPLVDARTCVDGTIGPTS